MQNIRRRLQELQKSKNVIIDLAVVLANINLDFNNINFLMEVYKCLEKYNLEDMESVNFTLNLENEKENVIEDVKNYNILLAVSLKKELPEIFKILPTLQELQKLAFTKRLIDIIKALTSNLKVLADTYEKYLNYYTECNLNDTGVSFDKETLDINRINNLVDAIESTNKRFLKEELDKFNIELKKAVEQAKDNKKLLPSIIQAFKENLLIFDKKVTDISKNEENWEKKITIDGIKTTFKLIKHYYEDITDIVGAETTFYLDLINVIDNKNKNFFTDLDWKNVKTVLSDAKNAINTPSTQKVKPFFEFNKELHEHEMNKVFTILHDFLINNVGFEKSRAEIEMLDVGLNNLMLSQVNFIGFSIDDEYKEVFQVIKDNFLSLIYNLKANLKEILKLYDSLDNTQKNTQFTYFFNILKDLTENLKIFNSAYQEYLSSFTKNDQNNMNFSKDLIDKIKMIDSELIWRRFVWFMEKIQNGEEVVIAQEPEPYMFIDNIDQKKGRDKLIAVLTPLAKALKEEIYKNKYDGKEYLTRKKAARFIINYLEDTAKFKSLKEIQTVLKEKLELINANAPTWKEKKLIAKLLDILIPIIPIFRYLFITDNFEKNYKSFQKAIDNDISNTTDKKIKIKIVRNEPPIR